MLNQKCVINENEIKHECLTKEDVGNNCGKYNEVYFSKYFGSNAIEKLISLLNLKANCQSVLIIENETNHINFSFEKYKIEFEPIRIAVDKCDKETIDKMCVALDDSIKICVVFGGSEEVSIAKYFARQKDMELVQFVTELCGIESFLDVSFIKSKNVASAITTKKADILYLDTNLAKNVNRGELVGVVFSMIAKLSTLIEMYIDCCFNKSNGYNEFENNVRSIFSRLSKILKKSIDLTNEDILNIIDLELEFSDYLLKANADIEDKEGLFAIIYSYLSKTSGQQNNYLRVIASQVYTKLYKDFVKNIYNIGNNFYDIENRVNLFDKTFNKTDLQFDFSTPATSQELYVLKRFQPAILRKLEIINCLIDKLVYKTLDIFEDSGYSFLQSIDKGLVMQSVYFSADVLQGKLLLKTMRNLGVLDFYC